MQILNIKTESCDCGCKGTTVTCGNIQFWYRGINDGKIGLFRGHGYSGMIKGEFKSSLDANRAAGKLIREEFKELGFLKKVKKTALKTIRRKDLKLLILKILKKGRCHWFPLRNYIQQERPKAELSKEDLFAALGELMGEGEIAENGHLSYMILKPPEPGDSKKPRFSPPSSLSVRPKRRTP